MISLIDLGGNIRKCREKRNYTQEHVADELGISRVQYGSIERGDNDVTITRLYNIAKILDTTI
jgi:transcriptional regulator with XRE-family HTH domain